VRGLWVPGNDSYPDRDVLRPLRKVGADEAIWLALGLAGLVYESVSLVEGRRARRPRSLTYVLKSRVLHRKETRLAFALFWVWAGIHLLHD